MAKGTGFIREHLEQIQESAFESYRGELKDVLLKKPGMYALYRRDKLVYVGMAKDLFRRLAQHRRDRHKGTWDRFSAYITRRANLAHEVETLALRVIQPPSNRKSGRFGKSHNLARDLEAAVEDRHRRDKAELLGDRRGKRHRRRAAKGQRGSDALSALSGKRRKLLGYYKGYEYEATLYKCGKIRFDGERFDSPSAAGKAARGRSTNGWAFWKYQDKRGDWVFLRELR